MVYLYPKLVQVWLLFLFLFAEPKPTKTKSLSAILDDLDNETNDNETDNETVETQFIASLHNKPLKGFKPFKGLVEKIKQTLFNFFFHAPLK